MSWWVYILRCGDDTFYTGYTNDVERRCAVHNNGKGAKYTRGRRPVCVVYREEFQDKSSAMKREAAVKKMTREEKMRLVTLGGYSKNVL